MATQRAAYVRVFLTVLACVSWPGAAHALRQFWYYPEPGPRAYAGTAPDGHSVLYQLQPNAVAIERIDTDGNPEAPFSLDLTDAGIEGTIQPSLVELDATGAIHVTATTQPLVGPLDHRYYRFSPTGALQWVLSSAADDKVCDTAQLSESGGRVFLCPETLAAKTAADFETRFRLSRYGANGVLEFSADPAIGLDNSATKNASAYVVLAPGANGRAGFGGAREVSLNGIPQPRVLFGVVIEATGAVDWNTAFAWSGTGNQIDPPYVSRAALGANGELALFGEGYGPAGVAERQYTVVRFGANGGSDSVTRLGQASTSGVLPGLVMKGHFDGPNALAAGRCVTALAALEPCYASIDAAGTLVNSSFGTAQGALPGAFPAVLDFAVGLHGETLMVLSADAEHSYLRRMNPEGLDIWEFGFAHEGEQVKSARVGRDDTGDFYYAVQFAPLAFQDSDRLELRKLAGGDVFEDSFE